MRAQTADIAVAPGRLLGATRFQVAWLDWDAPRPVFLTALANPSVAHDVAALPGLPTALIAVSSPTIDGRNWGVDGSDLLGVDLGTAEGTRQLPRPVVMRSDPGDSLSWPAWWPEGSAIVFQREDQTADGSERVLVDTGRFPEIFSPRYSPDGTHMAFGARAYADLQPMMTSGLAGLLSLVGPTTAYAHGTLADLWMINADGSDLRQVSSLPAHDPALAWAPDGSQLFASGSWGGVLIDLSSGENTLMTYLTGTTAVAWLP